MLFKKESLEFAGTCVGFMKNHPDKYIETDDNKIIYDYIHESLHESIIFSGNSIFIELNFFKKLCKKYQDKKLYWRKLRYNISFDYFGKERSIKEIKKVLNSLKKSITKEYCGERFIKITLTANNVYGFVEKSFGVMAKQI